MPIDKPYLYSSFYPYLVIDKISDDELLSLMRHEAHRIEKSIYNDIFETKKEIYFEKAKRLDSIFLYLIKGINFQLKKLFYGQKNKDII
jgi:hypothetical protein